MGGTRNELLAGASVVYQRALDAVELPALLLELPSRQIRAVNRAAASLVGAHVEEMIGRQVEEMVRVRDEDAMRRAFEALADRAIDGYRARRRVVSRDGGERDVYVWSRAVDVEAVRSAVVLISPVDTDGRPVVDVPQAWAGPLVVGQANPDYVVTTVSSDVRDVLGWEPVQLIGHSLLAAVHPDDAGPLMRLVESAPVDGATVRSVRLRHATGDWVAVQCLVLRVTESGQPPITFVLLREPPRHTNGGDRVAELEIHLRRIAAELRATGVLDDVEGMPLHVQLPELSSLTSRQWQIALRLMRGGRVAAIAHELNLSPGTVRNHLAAIYNLLGVHSQADLVELLRGRMPR